MGQTKSVSAIAVQQPKSYGSVEDKGSYASSAGEESHPENTKNDSPEYENDDSPEYENDDSPEAKAEHAEYRRQERSQRFVDLVTDTGLKTINSDHLEIETDEVLIFYVSDVPDLKYNIRYHPEMKAYIVFTTFPGDVFSCTKLLCTDTKTLVSTRNDYYMARKGQAYPTIQNYADNYILHRMAGKMGDGFAEIVIVDKLRRSGQLPATTLLTIETVDRVIAMCVRQRRDSN